MNTLTILIICITIYFIVLIITNAIVDSNKNNTTSTNLQSTDLAHIKVVPATNIVSDEQIQRKIHQIWLGEKIVPKQTQDWINLCERYGYEYKLWRDKDLKNLINQKYFDQMKSFGCFEGCIDIAKYEILYQNGGLFVDINMIPVDLPIFDYLPKTGFAITSDHNNLNLTSNQLILSCSKSSILKRVIDSLPINYENLKSNGQVVANKCTGSLLLNACLFGVFNVIDKKWIITDSSKKHDFHLIESYH